jgi:hypothetical protein
LLTGANLIQMLLLLPIFFAHLEVPIDLHNFVTVADDKGAVTPQFQARILALEAVRLLLENERLDGEICCVLWPRIFAWMEIRERHVSLHPENDSLIAVDLHVSALGLIPSMFKFPEVTNLMWKTPGVRGLLTRAWIALIDHPTRHIEYKLAMGQVLGSFMAVSRQANLEEVVSAAGGTLADLAELIVRSVGGASRLITSQECILEDAPNEEFNRGLVDGILDFVIQALRCEPLMRDALFEAGYMETLLKDVIASTACLPEGKPFVSSLHSVSYMFIAESLVLGAHPDLVCTAIGGHILQAMLTSAAHSLGRPGGSRDAIITEILPGYLAYYSVLNAVDYELDSDSEALLNDLLRLPWIRDTPLSKSWVSCRKLATERWKLVQRWIDDYSSVATCDNMTVPLSRVRNDCTNSPNVVRRTREKEEPQEVLSL